MSFARRSQPKRAASESKQSRESHAEPFLFTKVENVPTRRNAGATFQRETVKNEGQ